MKRIFFGLLTLLILLIMFFTSFANDKTNSIVNEGKRIYCECLRLKEQSTTRKVIFVRDYSGEDIGSWKRWNKNMNGWIDQFDLYVNKNKLRLANYTFISESGDTALYTNYYFRKDGTTALIINDYRVASGVYCQALTEIYISPSDKIIKNKKFIDLDTKKEIDGHGKEENTDPQVYINIGEFLEKNKIRLLNK